MDPIHIDAIWLAVAFLSGLIMRQLGLPTLIGFLATGFFLNYADVVQGNLKDILSSLSDLGITLLLFTIGLKIKVKTLAKKEILVTASAHMILSTLAFSGLVFLFGYTGLRMFSDITIESALIIGFALSFSSTVFVVKLLEERGEITSRHGKMAIGILIIQDIFAVLFITLTNDEIPSIWALTLPLYLYLVRFILKPLLYKSGHGEMLTIFGFFAPLILGSLAFDLVNLKYDLGALIIGMLLVNHAKADELYERMMSFKDFFLIAFFINIGLAETPSLTTLTVALGLLIFVFFKGYLFNIIMSFFNLRARTNFLTSLSLMNYSEFGLIVGAVGYKMDLISGDWLISIALLMALSFLLAAPFTSRSYELFDKFKESLTKINKTSKEIDHQPVIDEKINYLVVGIGSIGRSAFEHFNNNFKRKVLAVDYDSEKVELLKSENYKAVWGDTTDREFWEENNFKNVDLVILAMSDYASNYNTLKQINKMKKRPFKVSVICHYEDEQHKFENMNVDYVFNYKNELGEDFAEHAMMEHNI